MPDPDADEEARHKQSGDIDVIIVGAGITGLIAGRDLSYLGYKVCVMDSNYRVGGRVYSVAFPGTIHSIDLGGEWFDANVHYDILAEVKRYNLSVHRPDYAKNGKYAYCFNYPGRKVITKATIPEQDMPEYQRVTDLINHDMGLLLFSHGFSDRAVDYLDISWYDYVFKRLQCKDLMLDFHLSMAFTFMHADAKMVSAVAVLHFLCGFGTLEELSNTRPREGYPFEKPDLVRLVEGMGTLAERLADDILSHGGEVRLNIGIGTVICEPVPEKPCPRYCPKCARYTYPKCSLHGPRVRVVDGLGRQTRGRSCILAVPLNCIPCLKFIPALSDTLKHASEMCHVGEVTKAFVLASKIGAAVDKVQAWPGAASSWVSARYVAKINKDLESVRRAAGDVCINHAKDAGDKSVPAHGEQCKSLEPQRADDAKHYRSPDQRDDKSISTLGEVHEGGAHDARSNDDGEGNDDASGFSAVSASSAASSPSVRDGNTRLIHSKDPYTTDIKLHFQGETRYVGTGEDDDQSIGSAKLEAIEEEFDENGFQIRAHAIIGVVGPPTALGDRAQKLPALLRKHYPTARTHEVVSSDWKMNRHTRGPGMAIRAGATHLFSDAITCAKAPWDKKNLIIAGSDLAEEWTGWIEGAVNSGHAAANTMTAFLNPPVPVANFTNRYAVGADPRTT